MSTSAFIPHPSSLKILHVVPSLGPLRGGPSVVARSMARDLANAGLAVDVVTTDDNGPGRLDVRLGVPQMVDGVTYRYFPRQTRFYTVSLPLAHWLDQHVAGYDLVHVHALFSFASTAAIRAAQRRKVPYIVRPLGTLNRYGMQQRRPLFKRVSFSLFERRALARAAAVHYTSEQERLEAAELGIAHRAAVIPLAVEAPANAATEIFIKHYPQLAGRTVLLFLGRIDPKKGLDLLLPAFAQARRQIPGLALVIAGDGDPDYVQSLRRMAQEYGIEDASIWAGFLSGDAKAAALACADIFVLPSYSENFGIAVVEAMFAGVPVIVSEQVGIHQEIAMAGAGISIPCRVDRLTEAIIQLAGDPQRRRVIGAQAHTLADRSYSPPAVTGQLIDLYAGLTSRQMHGVTP